MFGLLGLLIKFIPAPARAWTAFALVIFLMMGVSAVWLHGKSTGWNERTVLAEREAAAQRAANEEAIRIASIQYFKRVDQVLIENQRLEDVLKSNDEAAAADPDAARCGISAASSMRLDLFR